MGRTVMTVAITIAAALCVVAVSAETPEVLTIDDCTNKKAAVEFPHAAHFELTECSTCHHTQEGLTADSGEAVESCSGCHTEPEEAETPGCSEMSLKKNPFHINCVG